VAPTAAFLGVPLTAHDGRPIGCLGVADVEPRAWTDEDRDTLTHVAASVSVELHLRAALADAEEACRSVIDSVGEVVFRTDDAGRWTMLTAPWTAVTGCGVDEALGRSFLDFVHPDDRDENRRAFEGLMTGASASCHHVVRYRAADGSCRWLEARIRVTTDADGRATGTFGTLNDVTAHHRDRLARLESEARLRLALDVAGLIAWERPLDDEAAPAPAAASRFADVFDLVHRDDRARVRRAVARAVTRHEDLSCECRLVLPNGATIWTDTVGRVLRDAHGRATRLVGVSLDTTARREAERARARKHSLLEATLEATGDGILVVDLSGRVASYNQRLLRIWGLPDEGYVGARLAPLLDRVVHQLADPEATRHRLVRVESTPVDAASGTEPSVETSDRIAFADGRVYERTSRPQRLDGEIIGYVWGFRDVTARSMLEAQLAHQAYHDALTGLANRTQLRLRVERALEHASRTGRAPDHVAVLLLDLDGFKLVNDAAGHAAGDALLRQVAERLLAATRGSDLVARLGGDEFGVLLERVHGDEDLVLVAERIMRALREPFPVLGATVVVGASIGIARGGDREVLDPRAGAMAPVDALLRNADLALYEAKGRGKGQHALFEPALHAAAMERVSMEAALRRALDRGELRLAFQPIVALGTGTLVGVEALARWAHPERGLVLPGQFIALAEETGLVVPLGRWVMREACREGARWACGHGLTVAVNVSGRQLQQAGFVDDVAAILAESGLPASSLVLELTETTVIQHPDIALERLTALKSLGVRLAVDDFGTGYSALSYLQQFPFDVLKIDKSFVDRIADGGQSSALAGAIVALSDALSLRTVAEGVETAAQRDTLAAMGCAHAQGFLFAQPMSGADVDRLLDLQDGAA